MKFCQRNLIWAISLKNIIVRLVESGAIDKDKFIKLYEVKTDLTTQSGNLLDGYQTNQYELTKKRRCYSQSFCKPLGIITKPMYCQKDQWELSIKIEQATLPLQVAGLWASRMAVNFLTSIPSWH